MLLSILRCCINGILLLNHLQACLGRMGGPKICILIIIKSVWQCKAVRETDLHPISRRPQPFRIVLFYILLLQQIAQNIDPIYIYTTVSRKMFDSIIQNCLCE